MDSPGLADDRVPLGDLTNTTHGGNNTRLRLVPLDGDHNEQKRQREIEQDATMCKEKSSERNKKHRQCCKMSNQENIDTDNNMVADSLDGNTTNEMDENSDWLHRQSTFSNSLDLLSDVLAPLRNTDDMDEIDTDKDINIVHETGSGYAPNRLVMCTKERRRAHDRARKAAMSPGQRALRNKRQRELYAAKKATKILEMTPKEAALIEDPVQTDDNPTKIDNNAVHEMGNPI